MSAPPTTPSRINDNAVLAVIPSVVEGPLFAFPDYVAAPACRAFSLPAA
jgi:hypothetical protein